MSEINKSILFIDDRANCHFDINRNTKISRIYQSIVKRFYDDGYLNFIIISERGYNDIVLESISKVGKEYPDAHFVPILNCRKNIEEPIEKKYDLGNIYEKFNENEYLLSQCNKMIYKTIEYQYNSRYTLLCKIKVNNARPILIYEVDLGNNKANSRNSVSRISKRALAKL